MPSGPQSQARPGWLLDEMATIGRENLDAGHVARYDAKEDGRAGTEVEDRRGDSEVDLLVEFGLDGGSIVLDLGAGTGQFALAAAKRCRRVVAIDPSPVMLGQLGARVAESGCTNLEVVEAGFLTYEHAGPPADFVYSRLALHHLPDFWKALALQRIHRMLRPAGILRLSDVVFSFDPQDIEGRIEAWCATLPVDSDNDREWRRADIEEHVRDEHSTFTWILEPMLERSGFHIERADYSDDGVQADYIVRAIEPPWRPGTPDGHPRISRSPGDGRVPNHARSVGSRGIVRDWHASEHPRPSAIRSKRNPDRPGQVTGG